MCALETVGDVILSSTPVFLCEFPGVCARIVVECAVHTLHTRVHVIYMYTWDRNDKDEHARHSHTQA
jgi:hypothetical protein